MNIFKTYADAIVGTHSPEHMRTNIEWLETELPLAEEAIEELHRRFDRLGRDWEQKT